MHASRAELSAQLDLMPDNFFSRAALYDATIWASIVSAFLIALLRSAINSSRIAEMWSSQPVAFTPQVEKNLSKSASDSQLRKSAMQKLSAIRHARMSFSHDARDFCFAAAANVRSSWAETPAALHDCSIKLSYVSDTSSAVQPATFFIHWAVAHA